MSDAPYRLVTGNDALRIFRGLHWGNDEGARPKRLRTPLGTRGTLVGLGALVAVEYATVKGDEAAVWRHEFGETGKTLPVLAVNKERRLVVAGGGYTVNERGIVG